VAAFERRCCFGSCVALDSNVSVPALNSSVFTGLMTKYGVSDCWSERRLCAGSVSLLLLSVSLWQLRLFDRSAPGRYRRSNSGVRIALQ